MPIPRKHIQERLQRAYVEAVVAKAGATCTPYHQDYGLDLRINDIRQSSKGNYQPSGIAFECQLKASTQCEQKHEHVVYDIKKEAYNKLVELESGLAILIVFKLPKNTQEWLKVEEDMFYMKHCCYWIHLTGEATKNKYTQRIRIPRNQIFTPQAVQDLLMQVRQQTRSRLEDVK